jgi:hypothetical protein
MRDHAQTGSWRVRRQGAGERPLLTSGCQWPNWPVNIQSWWLSGCQIRFFPGSSPGRPRAALARRARNARRRHRRSIRRRSGIATPLSAGAVTGWGRSFKTSGKVIRRLRSGANELSTIHRPLPDRIEARRGRDRRRLPQHLLSRNRADPRVATMLIFEGLPSIDAAFAVWRRRRKIG